MTVPRPRKIENRRKPFDKHVAGVDYGILDELAGYAIRRAQIAIYEELEPALAPLRITPPRFSSMVLIDRNPGILQSELATAIGVGRSAMVAIIDFLEAQGWLQRQAHAGDGRANHLVLTAPGHAQLLRAMATLAELDARYTSSMSAAERRTLLRLLDQVQPPREP